MYIFQNRLPSVLRCTLRCRTYPNQLARPNTYSRLLHSSPELFTKVRQKPPKSNKQVAQPSLRHVPSQPVEPQPPQPKDNIPYYHYGHGMGTLKTCTTVSTCEHYDLANAVDLFYKMGLRSATVLLPGEMVHVKYPFGAAKVADVLVLSNGTVVAWGMNESEVMEQVVPALELAEIRHYKVAETEDMDYIEEGGEGEKHEQSANEENISSHSLHTLHSSQPSSASTIEVAENRPELSHVVPLSAPASSPTAAAAGVPAPPLSTGALPHNPQNDSTMVGDVIYIRGDSITSRLLDKAAFSSGLARNTKLAALEISLDNYIKSIKELSDNLAEGRKIELRGHEVLQITGRLLQIRGHLNLYSELIETPDLYWSEPQLEQLYALISRKLDISPRIAILNKRLDYASELAGILKTHISEEQSTRLEWMIIILITVEVCFEIVHFVEKYGWS